MAATSDILAFVLDGLADYLELERELGVRTVEVDRREIVELSNNRIIESSPKDGQGQGTGNGERGTGNRERGTGNGGARDERAKGASGVKGAFDFVFIADRPLSPKAVEMMAKIIPAMGKTAETAPVVVAPPIPDARLFVFLGRAALAKYMPGLRGEENRWLKSPKGKDVLLVKSPEEIVRFTAVTPALKRMKQEMWQALKTVVQRVNLGA